MARPGGDRRLDVSGAPHHRRQAAFIGVGAMVGAGIFSLLGAAGEVAGVGGLGVVPARRRRSPALQGYSFAKLGARYPSAGGLLEYVIQGFGDGHFTGIIAWLMLRRQRHRHRDGRGVVRQLRQRAFADDDTAWVEGLRGRSIVVVMTVLNIVGSQAVARVQTVIVDRRDRHPDASSRSSTLANIDPHLLALSGYPPFRDIVSSVALTFFAFLGFGVITFTAKDLANPRRQLPRAMYLALGIATVIYVAVALGVFGTLTVDEVIASGGTALAVAAEPDARPGRATG